MHAVILAAGYGTRLTQDLQENTTGEWENIKNCPKPLLPLGSKPLITRWVLMLRHLEDIDKICVITNDKFYQQFVAWKAELADEDLERRIILYNDFSTCNEDRLGAVTDLKQAIQILPSSSNILVIAGDTMFRQDFSLREFLERIKDLQEEVQTASLICHTECSEEAVRKHGIVEIKENNRVKRFLEKPDPIETESRFQCPCFYILSESAQKLIATFLELHEGNNIEAKDATGKFVNFLVDRLPVFSYKVSGRFDLGNLASYREANTYFSL